MLGTTVRRSRLSPSAETAKSGPHLLPQPDHHAARTAASKTVNDLKGKTFAFVDPSSTSGHLFPKAGLIKVGFDPDKDFGRVLFSGSHDANALAVANKRVDAATIADRILDAAVAKGLVKRDDIHVVWRSDPIPESPTVLAQEPARRSEAADQGAPSSNIKDITWADQGKLNRFDRDQRRRPTTSFARHGEGR